MITRLSWLARENCKKISRTARHPASPGFIGTYRSGKSTARFWYYQALGLKSGRRFWPRRAVVPFRGHTTAVGENVYGPGVVNDHTALPAELLPATATTFQ